LHALSTAMHINQPESMHQAYSLATTIIKNRRRNESITSN